MSHGRFKFEKIAKYPHMKPEDIAVWERFIDQNPDFFDTVDYDFRVGEGAPQAPTLPENIARDGKILTQKKIDVIGYNAGNVWIIEVKPIANMRGLGQLLTYQTLYLQRNTPTGFIFPMIIAGEMERELKEIFAENRIAVKIV